MLLIDHLFRTSLFPLQHYVQRRGAILEALYRIPGGFWFSPLELVMTSLMHFEEKVHRKDLVRAESNPLLMSRLHCQVLEHMGFPEEPRLEMRVRCPLVMSVERVMTMPVSFHLRQQDQKEVPGQEAEDAHTDDMPALSSRYRGVQLHRCHLHLLLHTPHQQPQQILPALPIQHIIRRSTFMPARGR